MNHLKENPKGLDAVIQKLQTRLYKEFGYRDELVNNIPTRIETNNFNAFGRVYLMEVNKKMTPINFISGSEYEPINFDDSKDGILFFLTDGKEKRENKTISPEVEIVFLLNLEKLEPTITHRAEEEVKLRIIEVLKHFVRYDFDEIHKGKDALKGLDIDLVDMQPYHFIKFKGLMKYYIN